jgi:hypothetical protein
VETISVSLESNVFKDEFLVVLARWIRGVAYASWNYEKMACLDFKNVYMVSIEINSFKNVGFALGKSAIDMKVYLGYEAQPKN